MIVAEESGLRESGPAAIVTSSDRVPLEASGPGFEASGVCARGLFSFPGPTDTDDPRRMTHVPCSSFRPVLTVEDDPIIRADLRLVLETAGFDVCPDARDGVEAIELAREHEPDVILLDLGLPRLGGVDATRLLLADRDVPIVALTGMSGELVDEAMDAGVTSVVRKPFAEGAVVLALQDAVIARKRRTSRAAIADLLALLGYPEDWSEELEQSAFSRGIAWRHSGDRRRAEAATPRRATSRAREVPRQTEHRTPRRYAQAVAARASARSMRRRAASDRRSGTTRLCGQLMIASPLQPATASVSSVPSIPSTRAREPISCTAPRSSDRSSARR